jgi:hypothetical protein
MRIALLIAAAIFAAGCGQTRAAEPTSPSTRQTGGPLQHDLRRCTHLSRGFHACTTFRPTSQELTAIYERRGSRWARVAGGPRGEHGWWRRVVASPDGRYLLGQWSGECEAQSTYLLSRRGGRPRSIFGHAESRVVGWTADGLARVRLVTAIYRGNRLRLRPGTYRVDPRTLRAVLERGDRGGRGC